MKLTDADLAAGVFFTADHHFGHANIIRYTNRPFADVEEMDAEMIRRWNDAVEPGAKVFHLGDFTLGNAKRAAEYFEQLNGTILVLGNDWHHDRQWLAGEHEFRTATDYVHVIEPLFVLDVVPYPTEAGYSQGIMLCHYPMALWDRSHHGGWHLHGHSHGQYQAPAGAKILDVGVDANNFTPVSLEEIRLTMTMLGGD